MFDDGVLVAHVGPGLADGGMVDGDGGQQLAAGGVVLDARGGDQDHQ